VRASVASRLRAIFRLCTITAALAVPCAFALNPDEKPANYIAAHWDTEDGLPHNSIKQLFQTRDGYLWIGTQQGLARFDGLAFTIFNRHNTPAFSSNSITSLAETSDGSLWIGTSSELIRYLDGKFTSYGKADGLKSTTINSVCVAPDGSLWIGGREGVVRWVGGKFVNDIDTSAYDTFGMRNITVDRQNTIWVAFGSGALRYRNGTFTSFGSAAGLPARQLQMISEDVDGNTLAVTQDGLLRLEDGRFVPFEQNAGLSSPRISRTLVDRAGNLWVGSVAGLDRWHHGRVVPYVDRYGNKLGVTDALLEDREGCLWIGTSGGLYRLTDRRAYSLSREDGVPGSLVLSLTQTRDGSLWVSSWGAGVTRFQNGASTRFTPGSPLSNENVTVIYEAPDGAMWFGNRGSSLDRLEAGKVTTYVYQSGVASNRPVTALLTDDSGTLLVGIGNRGLLQLRDGQIVPVPETAALAEARATVWSIYRTADGRLLMGTSLGLYQRRLDRTWQPVEFPTLKAPVVVRDFLEVDGTLWLATDGHGLVRWKNGEARAYGARLGMVDDTLFSVRDDGQGAFWVSSARGLARIRQSEFAAVDRGTIGSLNRITFGRGDGLLSSSTSGSGSPSAIRLTDGRLMTATDQGVAVIDPLSLRVNQSPPTVVVETVLADDQPLPPGREVIVAAGSSKLEIRYTALSLIAPERLRFRYQLEGSDPRWVEAGYSRSARYTHLAPGRYTFHVLASNNDGVWNNTGATLAVTMQPLFYQTLWFRLAAFALLSGALSGVIGLRLRRLKLRAKALARANAELDQRVRERTAELQQRELLFRLIFEHAPVGISWSRTDLGAQNHFNSAFRRILELPAETLPDNSLLVTLTHPEDAPRQAESEALIRSGKSDSYALEQRFLRKDGKQVSGLVAVAVVRDPQGQIIQHIRILEDITALKEAEQELANTYKRLVEISRQAGMAEIATSVLHNVGNVLNSVGVSATLVANHVRHTQAVNIAKLAALFDAHKADLAEFLTTDSRGQMIPGYLGTLAESLAAEQQTLITELELLRKNIEHIKEIVAMQQTNTRTSGVTETISIPDLLEEALCINADALARYDVTTIRDYQACPAITTDKHKVLQILINLVRNAKLACVDSSRTDRQITVRTTSDDRGVKIAIIDNGIGIPTENLTRIFNHGFTTRKRGHGFALHSGALAAKELGGSLSVQSDGLGHGATFVLELPYDAGKPNS
jgi:PAS domain S-box-containing protein